MDYSCRIKAYREHGHNAMCNQPVNLHTRHKWQLSWLIYTIHKSHNYTQCAAIKLELIYKEIKLTYTYICMTHFFKVNTKIRNLSLSCLYQFVHHKIWYVKSNLILFKKQKPLMLYWIKIKCIIGIQLYRLHIQIPLAPVPALYNNSGVTPKIFIGQTMKYHGLCHKLLKYS
jgi:hypothetical protein